MRSTMQAFGTTVLTSILAAVVFGLATSAAYAEICDHFDPDDPCDSSGGGSSIQQCCTPCGNWSVVHPAACCHGSSPTSERCWGNTSCSANPCLVTGQTCKDCP